MCRFFGLIPGPAVGDGVERRRRAADRRPCQPVMDDQSPKSAQCDALRRSSPRPSDIHGRDAIAPAVVVPGANCLGRLAATMERGGAEENGQRKNTTGQHSQLAAGDRELRTISSTILRQQSQATWNGCNRIVLPLITVSLDSKSRETPQSARGGISNVFVWRLKFATTRTA